MARNGCPAPLFHARVSGPFLEWMTLQAVFGHRPRAAQLLASYHSRIIAMTRGDALDLLACFDWLARREHEYTLGEAFRRHAVRKLAYRLRHCVGDP